MHTQPGLTASNLVTILYRCEHIAGGVDLVKEDSCSAPTDHNASFAQYALMRDALNATGRPIYFALCGWSSWYAPVGATLGNSWRYGYDVNDWNSAYSNSIASATSVAADAVRKPHCYCSTDEPLAQCFGVNMCIELQPELQQPHYICRVRVDGTILTL
jgi:hypothetical protein